MAETTVDIEDLKDRKVAAIERDMTLKELVNTALREYLEDDD